MKRKKALLEWTQNQLNDYDCYIKPASNDASFRTYWRVYSQGTTYIVMDAPVEHEDCRPFIAISAKLVDSGINVPKVLQHDLTQGFLLLTDLGTTQYLEVLNAENFQQLYHQALTTLETIQSHTSQVDLPLYDETLLRQEMRLFADWFIDKHLGINLSEAQTYTLKSCYDLLVTNALEQPQTFVHRDYHSRNLMYCKHNNPGVLDFQDALIGPITYDLVSLLKDCYISWDTNAINQIADNFRQQHNQRKQTDITQSQWQRWFDLIGMQRHLKAIGIFCRLNYRDSKPNYLKDINRTLCYVKSVCQDYPELHDFLNLIRAIIPSADSLCER